MHHLGETAWCVARIVVFTNHDETVQYRPISQEIHQTHRRRGIHKWKFINIALYHELTLSYRIGRHASTTCVIVTFRGTLSAQKNYICMNIRHYSIVGHCNISINRWYDCVLLVLSFKAQQMNSSIYTLIRHALYFRWRFIYSNTQWDDHVYVCWHACMHIMNRPMI